MSWFAPWIAEHFLNPAYFWPGVALLAAPIIIHLINRLRYRRVRFAAMEFLLASQQRSRRRILLEQLLLLLLRVLIVLLLALLIARLILDPSQLSLFQGVKSHHVVLLDDSGSMRDRWGNETAFERAKAVIRRLVSEGARRPGTQRFTLLLLSQPDTTYANLGERDIDAAFVDELTAKLESLACTHGRGDLIAGLEAARRRLSADPAAARYLHVLSDFREADWNGNQGLSAALAALAESEVSLNFVRVITESHQNLAVTSLAGAVEVAAAGIPVELTVTVQNFGQREAVNVRLSVAADGQRLPLHLVFESIPAGEVVQRGFDIRFDAAGKHRVEVSLEADALEADNVRHLTLDVPVENDVLIVDNTPGAEQANFIRDALAADRSVTGYAPLIVNVDGMRRKNLSGFQSIYLVNVPEMPPDALQAVKDFVAGGGGLSWFVGDAVRPAYYNGELYEEGKGLFPVPLGPTLRSLDHPEPVTGPDLLVEAHPVFSILTTQDNPFIDVVRVNHYHPVETGEAGFSSDAFPQVKIIARLRNRDPVILEHVYGDGRIVTFLTAAGPIVGPDKKEVWNNWASGPAAPSYAIMHLELQKYIARRNRLQPRRIVREPIIEQLDRSMYQEDVEVVTPGGEALLIKAAAPEPSSDEQHPSAPGRDAWVATYRETDEPGVYIVRRVDHQQQADETWMAYNVPIEESPLEVAEVAALRQQAGSGAHVAIQEGEALDWIQSDPPGQDVRWWLLAGLILLFVGEQALAYRLSYH